MTTKILPISLSHIVEVEQSPTSSHFLYLLTVAMFSLSQFLDSLNPRLVHWKGPGWANFRLTSGGVVMLHLPDEEMRFMPWCGGSAAFDRFR